MGKIYKDEQDDWITVCLKYLLFVFNFLFWVSSSNVSSYTLETSFLFLLRATVLNMSCGKWIQISLLSKYIILLQYDVLFD